MLNCSDSFSSAVCRKKYICNSVILCVRLFDCWCCLDGNSATVITPAVALRIKDLVTALSCTDSVNFLIYYIVLAIGWIFYIRDMLSNCHCIFNVRTPMAYGTSVLSYPMDWTLSPLPWEQGGGRSEEVIPEPGLEPATSLLQSRVVKHSVIFRLLVLLPHFFFCFFCSPLHY